MSLETPHNDLADQLRPVERDHDVTEIDERFTDTHSLDEPMLVGEADPADVADQHREVPFTDDRPDDSSPPAGHHPVGDPWCYFRNTRDRGRRD